MTLDAGARAPDFSLPADGGDQLDLARLLADNHYVVLYFYPKDDTPGCTTEAKDFSALEAAFRQLGAVVVGVSKDTPAKHDKFRAKHELTIRLASDESGEVLEDYGVWVEKSLYGKRYRGIERTTFLIAQDREILVVWPKVRVKGHAEAVLAALRERAVAE